MDTATVAVTIARSIEYVFTKSLRVFYPIGGAIVLIIGSMYMVSVVWDNRHHPNAKSIVTHEFYAHVYLLIYLFTFGIVNLDDDKPSDIIAG